MYSSYLLTLFLHRFVAPWLTAFLLLPILVDDSQAQAAPLPIKEETLGAWHYLWPLEIYSGGGAMHGRPVSAPSVVEFGGGRIAVMLPGSEKVAEFKERAFEDLGLPAFTSPSSLAVDREGKLYCLLQRTDHLQNKDGWHERWISAWSEATGWSEPVQVPFPDADRIEFDTQNRLWALGPAPGAAVFVDGKWDRCPSGHTAPPPSAGAVRIAAGENGDVILFDAGQEYRQMPPPSGVVIYHEGTFNAGPARDVTALRTDQKHRDDALIADNDLERRTGYIGRSRAQNIWHSRPTTVLHTAACILVSFGNEGLAWADTEALRMTPALKEDDEWEEVGGVSVPPAKNAEGALWMVREGPRRFVKIGKEKQQEFLAADLPVKSGISSLDFDLQGRPWVHSWSGQEAAALLDGDKLRMGKSEIDLLRTERSTFQMGRIFLYSALAVKTPTGAVCLLDYEHFMIGDEQGVHTFSDEQISPGHTRKIMMPRHGYNSFRNGEPQFDGEGNIYTKIDGNYFRYRHGHWQEALPLLLPPAEVSVQSDIIAPYATRLAPADGRDYTPGIIFRCLHFYEQKMDGNLEQIDHGLNPLALYPFWTGWHNSPGETRPVIDPRGRIWIIPCSTCVDGHAGGSTRLWMRLREGRWL